MRLSKEREQEIRENWAQLYCHEELLVEIYALRGEREAWKDAWDAAERRYELYEKERDQLLDEITALRKDLDRSEYQSDKRADERNKAEQERDKLRADNKILREALQYIQYCSGPLRCNGCIKCEALAATERKG